MWSKKVFILCVFCVVCLFGQIICAAQNFARPSRLILKGSENAKEEAESASLLREEFYPIGWSKDGKFAFLVEPTDEACGCYFANLVIQDLRNDKILWSKYYEGNGEKEEDLKTFWKQNQKEFSRKLKQYGIIAQRKFDLQHSSFGYHTDNLNPQLRVNAKMDDELYTSGEVVLQLISKSMGAKTIYSKKFNPKKYEGFLDAELGGSLISPFEARAVVIMVEVYRGWEGFPYITQLRIVGASLKTGFGKG